MPKITLFLFLFFSSINCNAQLIHVHFFNGNTAYYNISEIQSSGVVNFEYEIFFTNGTIVTWNNNLIEKISYSSTGVANVETENFEIVNNVKVYPNPGDGKMVTIDFQLLNDENIQWEITNSVGKVIHSNKVTMYNKGSHLIEWYPESILSAGIYFCRLSTANFSITKNLVIQH